MRYGNLNVATDENEFDGNLTAAVIKVANAFALGACRLHRFAAGAAENDRTWFRWADFTLQRNLFNIKPEN